MKIRVNPHTVEIIKEQTEPINEKEIKVSKCEFEFDEAITSDFVKEAYFTLNGNTYKKIVENNECDYPSEVLTEKGTLEIGVVAFKVENNEEIIRYNPSPDYFESWVGSLKAAENSEPITPSEMEQFEQELQEGLNEIDDKIDEVDDKIEEVNTAITETNNLDLDVDKVGKVATVTLTKKDASTKVVTLSDGTSLMFNWQGTSLGIKTDEDADYTYVDLQGVQGVPGPKGDAFQIKKTYPTVEAMNADFNNMELGDYVMIASEVSIEDNAKLYTRGQNAWIFISDFSGAQGIKGETGATPNIQIGTVTSGSTPSVTRTGTNENPVLNFVLQPGPQGDTGPTGPTGNGIDHISLTSQSGATKVYTIYFTDGNTTTFTVQDGEVTQEVFDEEIERANMIYNAMPKVSGEGTDLTLNNTAECPVYDIELSPSELEQETTTGKNLMPTSLELMKSLNTTGTWNNDVYTLNDVTWTPVFENNELQYVNANGTASGTSTFSIGRLENPENNQYIGTGCPANGSDSTYRMFFSNMGSEFGNGITRTVTDRSRIDCSATVYDGYTASNLVYYPMLRLSSVTDATYEPYTNGASPNPQYPQEIHTVSGDNEVKVEGKNLFDKNTEVDNYYIDASGNITANAGFSYSALMPVEQTNYILKGTTYETSTKRIHGYNSSGTWIKQITYKQITANNDYSIPITINDSNIKYIRISIKIADTNVKVIKNSEIASYPVNLGSMELCKIGDYEDLFFKNVVGSEYYDSTLELDKWYLKKNVGKVVLNGSENWTYNTQYNFFALNITSIVNDKVYSNYYLYYPNYASVQGSYGCWTVQNSFRIKNTDYSTTTDFKTWLSTHNTKLYYVLTTPTYTLLSNTLQTQLDNIHKAISYQDQTNISQTNADLPFVIKLSAIRDLSGIFEEI